MPEVEAACIEDLSSHCSDDDEHKKVNGVSGGHYFSYNIADR